MANTTEDQLKQLYGAQLESQKATLTDSYNQANDNLNTQQEQAKKIADQNVNLTKVENQKAAVNNAEYYAAAGLSSGAKAQARLAMDNQLQADIATIRAAQQAADANTERQRSLLAKEYSLAIQKAQSENDMALAQALYEDAQKKEADLLAKQEEAAGLMAKAGDFTRYGDIYGLTPAEIAALSKAYAAQNAQPTKPTDTTNPTDPTIPVTGWNNGKVTEEDIRKMQDFFGVDADGKWGAKSSAAAGNLSADAAWQYFQSLTPDKIAAEHNALKANGATMKERLAFLTRAMNAGFINNDEAARIFNGAWGVNPPKTPPITPPKTPGVSVQYTQSPTGGKTTTVPGGNAILDNLLMSLY